MPSTIDHPYLKFRNDKDQLEPIQVNHHRFDERWEWDPDYVDPNHKPTMRCKECKRKIGSCGHNTVEDGVPIG